ncbi:MAG TPA: transcriptional regulator GcvA [Aliidongia sp.]|uniref:transcriptional regulator GcvA n=1 Tax=Aliidongia sp. TaxID=1914230 RepID=UPI002DDDAF07|nr:transcriptional regulator GcvA [Aliidongia sp.]HEV2674574.1 transcriptional regulator GcvA [Aliidongia sp.]
MRQTRLPSLNALKAFEAAGRLLSVTAAADALAVTPSAISRQVRQLEEDLGLPLFRRVRTGLVLTEAGTALLTGLSDGFQRIALAVDKVRPRPESGVVTVSMLSTFAMRWLLPRLGHFNQAHPEIEVRLSTSVELVDLARGDIDCAIRFGRGDWPGLVADRLFAERLTAVCSPALLAKGPPLAEPGDLRAHTLLHARLRADHWRIWLHEAGLDELDCRAGPLFETRNFVIQAALQGLGVAVIDPALVGEELESGRLVQLFPRILALEGAYFLVRHPTRMKLKRVAAFRDWLLSEVGEEAAP